MFLKLAVKSLISRKASVLLTVFAMTLSILVMLGVEHIRHQAKSSFASSVSGVDLIVGTRTGKLNLLLYSVFRMGSPTNNMSWQAYSDLANSREVEWAVPISLGDSHKGFRVLGTTQGYFEHFSYGQKQQLTFAGGEQFNGVFDVVLGAKVASDLGYKLGDRLTLSHGVGSTSFKNHDQAPFEVVGILNPTGTPVDQTLHVSLQGIEAVHLKSPMALSADELEALTPKSVTAAFVGLKSKMMVFSIQRRINTNNSEPLMAMLPGVALSELWQSMSVLESTLKFISVLVFISSLMGLSAMLLTSMKERAQEINLLRMMGASRGFIYWFIELEAMLITLVSTLLAMTVLFLGLVVAQSYILTEYGLSITPEFISNTNVQTLAIVFGLAFVAAIPPAYSAFRRAK